MAEVSGQGKMVCVQRNLITHTEGLPSAASKPLKASNATGQIVRFLNRTYHLLLTLQRAMLQCKNDWGMIADQLSKTMRLAKRLKGKGNDKFPI